MFRSEVAIWMLALLTVVEPMAYAAVSPAAANETEKFGATMPEPIRGLS
jgi:hypothetical protein